jgi:hypothetical protein
VRPAIDAILLNQLFGKKMNLTLNWPLRSVGMIIRQRFVILIMMAVCIVEGFAAHRSPQQKQPNQVKQQPDNNPPAKPQDIVLFLNDVRSAPPEFAVDLMIRIAESERVADLSWKRELIEEAFRLASTVQQPVKLATLPSIPTDTRSGFLARAFEKNLDALSLQCRSVKSMLSVDKQKARALFSEISRPQLPAINCEDALIYDVFDFYTTLKMIAETTFKQKEIKRGEHIWLIEHYINQISSPVEVTPVIDLIISVKVLLSQKESLLNTFNKAFSRLSGDDRSFVGTLYNVDQRVRSLVNQLSQQGVSIDDLLKAYRAYIIRHFSAVRCADNDAVLSNRTQSGIIKGFNTELRLKSDRNVLEIADSEIKPAKVEGVTKAYMHWQSPKSSAVLMKLKELRFGSGKEPLTLAERESLSWKSEMNSLLKDLAQWKKEDEKSEEDYFHQKCIAFRALIELTPQKASREEVIRSFVGFLNDFDISSGSRIEWFWQADFLLKDKFYLGSPNSSAPDYVIKRSEMTSIAEITKNLVLYLYLQVDKVLAGERPKA